VPVEIHAPAASARFPVVVFLHGRRGIDPLTRLVPLRLAARGFTVVVPDLYSGRLSSPSRSGTTLRWRWMPPWRSTLRLRFRGARTGKDLCRLAHPRRLLRAQGAGDPEAPGKHGVLRLLLPHWQHPEAPEPMQVYQYAAEVDALEVPVLVFLGEHEQYQRARRSSPASTRWRRRSATYA